MTKSSPTHEEMALMASEVVKGIAFLYQALHGRAQVPVGFDLPSCLRASLLGLEPWLTEQGIVIRREAQLMSVALRHRLNKMEKVNPPRPLAGLSAEEQVAAVFAKMRSGWASEAEHELYVNDMSEEALELAIAELNRAIAGQQSELAHVGASH
jgi:hypothetical protein